MQLQRLQMGQPIVSPQGTPSIAFQIYWQQFCEGLERTFSDIIAVNEAQTAAIEAIEAAQSAADAANEAAGVAQAAAVEAGAATAANARERSLNNSYPSNFTAPLVSADAAGNVTIAPHDRVYGDSSLDPTVAVDGDTVATGLASPSVARVYYVQPSRAGGAVSYLITEDPAVAAQTGDTHSVGAVAIPATGTASGGHVTPPGYASSADLA